MGQSRHVWLLIGAFVGALAAILVAPSGQRPIYVAAGSLVGAYVASVVARAVLPGRHQRAQSLAARANSKPTFDKGLQFLTEEVSRSRGDVASVEAIACWLDVNGRNDLALPHLRRAATRWPEDRRILNQWAWAEVDVASDSAEAAAAIEAAEKRPYRTDFLSDTKAWRLFRLGKPSEAWMELEGEALKGVDQSPDIAYHAAAIRHALDDLRAARHYTAAALRNRGKFNGRAAAIELSKLLGGVSR